MNRNSSKSDHQGAIDDPLHDVKKATVLVGDIANDKFEPLGSGFVYVHTPIQFAATSEVYSGFFVAEEGSAAVAHHSLKRVMDKCDMRIGLWIDKIEPKWEQCGYDRSLVRNWATSEINAAVRKRRDARKKEFLRTALPYSIMSPWR